MNIRYTYEEFIDFISRGGEVEFEYAGKEYAVLPLGDVITVGIKYSDDWKYYRQPEDIGTHLFDGKFLREIIDDIKIIFP